ncbi:MAG TPA: MFS transporter [Acidimicrobiales bacterium]|nr:MFS transporter [Acidimicrobiales bacterium]
MYISLRRRPSGNGPVDSPPDGLVPSVGGNVVALGLTSLFTDISSEMVTAVLPLYLTFELRLSATQFGVIDGLTQAVTALTLLAGAVVADRSRRYKEVAFAGYAVSAGCKVGLLAVRSSWMPLTGMLFLDRTAKGLRTPPRDSLISLSAPPGRLGSAFGVHRALDTTGAVLGPFVAFLLLFAAPGAYSSVFLISFCVALVGVGILAVFVDKIRDAGPVHDRVLFGAVAELVRMPALRRLLAAAALLNVLTISDAFVYLTLQHRSSFQSRFFPLLFVGTAVAYLALAVPFGRLADGIGPRRVVAGGYVLLLCAYGSLLLHDPGPLAILAVLALLGGYYAATDGVLMALASTVVGVDRRATGLALVATVVAGSRLVSSTGFGFLWSRMGPRATVVTFLVALTVALPVAVRLFAASARSRS